MHKANHEEIVNTLRHGKNGRRLPGQIFQCVFFKENYISHWFKFHFKFVPRGPIKSKSALVSVLIWRRTDKLWPEPMLTIFYGPQVPGGRFKNTYELLIPRALKISMSYKIVSFNVRVRYFVWNFKGSLWNSTQNILPIHWKMCILFTGENLRALLKI